jgi:Aromatic-ring-opening dioxygenase LigAB, LigA subunit
MRNWRQDMPSVEAYWIGRVLYDVHHKPGHLERYKADPMEYMAGLPLSEHSKTLVRENRIGELYLAGANPYLIRAHSLGVGVPEPEFLRSLRAVAEEAERG